jgi:hypothetical protein
MNSSSSSDIISNTTDRYFSKIGNLLNPLIDGEIYQDKSDNKTEIDKKKKNDEAKYIFNERIIYNSISNDCLINSKLDTTNIYYYEKYLILKEDFDYENYMNLINIRQKYLMKKLNIIQNEISRNKKEISKQKQEKSIGFIKFKRNEEISLKLFSLIEEKRKDSLKKEKFAKSEDISTKDLFLKNEVNEDILKEEKNENILNKTKSEDSTKKIKKKEIFDELYLYK